MKCMHVLFVLLLASAAGAVVSVRIDGVDTDSISLKEGQEVTVEVVSSNTAIYSAFIGFADAASRLGAFEFIKPLSTAGNLASVVEVGPPPVVGYYVSAAGTKPAPEAGVHFLFAYVPETVGSTVLCLYGKDGVKLLDSVTIVVEPAATGSAFTYQGRLLDGGEGRDGIYDFEFRLFDAPTGGKLLGETNYGDDIEVAGGYFTAELDFGAAYEGQSAWLEVAVREGISKEPFAVLAPRQRLTATPNASYAARSDWGGLLNVPAGFADGVDNNTHLSESQVEGYIVNDLATGSVPYDTGTRLGDTSLQYSPTGGLMRIGGTGFNADRKFSVFTNANAYALCAEAAGTTGTNVALYGAASGDTASSGYGVFGTSASDLGTNFGVYGTASAPTPYTNYGVYGYAVNGGTGKAYAGYFNGEVKITGRLNYDADLRVAGAEGTSVAIGGDVNSDRKLFVYTMTNPCGIHGESAGNTSNSCGVRGVVSGNVPYGYGIYGYSNSATGTNCGVYGLATDESPYDSYGLVGLSLSSSGNNYGVMGRANAATSGVNYGVYGAAAGGEAGSWAGYFSGNVYTTGNVSAGSFTDRTPYPKDLATAVEAVMSMSPLGAGEYDEHNKEQQLDHSGLSEFVRSEDGKRDLSATVSCHNEVLKDLLGTRQELLEARAQIRQLQEENAAMQAKMAAIETALNKMNLVQ